jgi:nitroreductase / dihydropteridine reductase
MTVHELLLKRYATKKFDATKKVSEEDLNYILEAARLSASSANTQPWFITVVTNSEIRAALLPESYNQPQVVDASHLLVISTIKDPMVRANKTAEIIAAAAGQENADKYLNMAKGWLQKEAGEKLVWLQKQVYIALQAMMLAAIEKGIDSCPMEGFNPAKYAEILELTEVVPTLLLPIGYAAVPGFPKTRVPLEDIVGYKK